MDESLSSMLEVLSIESVRELPRLLLPATISIILSWVEPMCGLVGLDIGDESNLVDGSVECARNCDLSVGSIDLSRKTLGDCTCISPNCLLLGVSSMSDSSMWWWQDTRSILEVLVISMMPLPSFNIFTFVALMAGRVAMAILRDTCRSMLGDVVFFTMVILDIFMDLGPFVPRNR